MLLINSKTGVYFLFSIFLAVISELAIAAEQPQVDLEKIKLQIQLKQLYADKKKPIPTILTESYKEQKSLKIKKTFQVEDIRQKGGVSDGGGNAVGQTFFDFFENEGSLEVNLDEVLSLEPRAIQLLSILDEEVPAVEDLSSGSFAQQLKKSLSGKKIYLESKPITSAACLNQSLVASDQQTVVACQTDEELRFNVQWLQDTTAMNRSGLLTHELILAWARANLKELPKQTLEQKVRELNRNLYAQNNEKNIANLIMNIFNKRAYNKHRYEIALTIPAKINKATRVFCENPMTDLSSEFQEIMQDKFLRTEVSEKMHEMIRKSEEVRSSRRPELASQFQNSACEDYRIDKLPIHEPNLDIIPDGCIRNIRESANNTAKYLRNEKQEFTDGTARILTRMTLTTAKSSANLCSGLRGLQLEKQLFMTQEKGRRMMAETFAEAINYFRYLLQQQGLKVSFMKDGE